MRTILMASLMALAVALTGCPTGQSVSGPNPFLTLAEQFGAGEIGDDQDEDGGGDGDRGLGADDRFRETMTLTLVNHSASDLVVNVAAWVLPESIRSAEQEDALFRGGYNRLSQEVRIGSAYVLPPGTFVRDAGGLAGAQAVLLRAAAGAVDFAGDEDDDADDEGEEEDDGAPAGAGDTSQLVETFITPDVLLLYGAPPTSCESPGFAFSDEGFPPDSVPIDGVSEIFGSATNIGTVKTLAQYDVYDCQPFRPGLFFKRGGGARADNEYFEGQSVRVDFSRTGLPNTTAFAVVTIQ